MLIDSRLVRQKQLAVVEAANFWTFVAILSFLGNAE